MSTGPKTEESTVLSSGSVPMKVSSPISDSKRATSPSFRYRPCVPLNETVDKFMNDVGSLYGSTEVRQNVNDLRSHLTPAAANLKMILPLVGSSLSTEIEKLLIYYENMSAICVEMGDRMELPEVDLCATTHSSESSIEPTILTTEQSSSGSPISSASSASSSSSKNSKNEKK